MEPTYVGGLEELADAYDAFVIDQWGVIHDGTRLYPGAIRVFRLLREIGKPAVILTNSRKRTDVNITRLSCLGLTRDLYDGLISSAEVLRNLLVARSASPWKALGDRVFVVGLPDDLGLLDGTRYRPVPNVESCDFVLLLSTANGATADAHDGWLRKAAARCLPLVTSSAELLTVNEEGVFTGLAGLVRRYRRYGGTVITVGKPHSEVYRECDTLLAGLDNPRILAIGDQFESDVVGAKRHGYHAAMVLTGAASVTLQGVADRRSVAAAIAGLGEPGVSCDFVLSSLRWGPAPVSR